MKTSISTPTAEHQTQPAQPGTIRTAAELTIETGHITVERYQVDDMASASLTLAVRYPSPSTGRIHLHVHEAQRLAAAVLQPACVEVAVECGTVSIHREPTDASVTLSLDARYPHAAARIHLFEHEAASVAAALQSVAGSPAGELAA